MLAENKAAETDSCAVFWKVLVLSTVWLGTGGKESVLGGGCGRLRLPQTLELLISVSGGGLFSFSSK